ncbi:MAG: methyl-accepting chemotaxis protein [Proteobacteria bacterium]|uniref:Methyl-accepting chemotaxis protein n=1 Tax=Candidatus Avisuccinivibrio stercorigallinarum TaxID=2840704 RepID=A0A9D9GTB2_9GAMM|nr:methyl-accepting chemotaxis protein [Candidatus Avisuccinivibrio stercorigallinarum]
MRILANIKTKTKLLLGFGLVILLTILVSATAVKSNIESIQAATDIDTILTRSYSRVNNTQTALLNANILAINALNPSNGANKLSADEFETQMNALIKQIGEAASVMNENKIGDLDSSDKYKQDVLNVKTSVAQWVQLYNQNVAPVLAHKPVSMAQKANAFNQMLTVVFPAAVESLGFYRNLIDEQIAITKELAVAGADPTMLYVGLGITVFSFIVGLLIAIYLSHYMAASLAEQAAIMERIAAGDFTGDIKVESNDEFGQSKAIMLKMKNSLNASIGNVINEANSFQRSLIELQTLTDEIVSQTSQAENQSVTVAAASDEMVSTTAEIAKNCEGAASLSEQSKQITSDGVEKVRTAVHNIQQQSHDTKENANKIESLAQQSNAIGSIVNTIEEIAAQTNLLALNAAIEAARAGDAGRGFAVVADEVRALAQRTSKSTQEIAKMVGNIQSEAQVATESINQSVGNMDRVAEDASGIESILQEIIQRVLDVNGQITQIATAAEEQTTATSEISTNMQGVTAVTQEVSSQARNAHESLGSLHQEMERLKNDLAFFKLTAAA